MLDDENLLMWHIKPKWNRILLLVVLRQRPLIIIAHQVTGEKTVVGGSIYEPLQQAPGPMQPMQWMPKIPLMSLKPFSGDRKKEEDLDTWVRTVLTYVRHKLTRPEQELVEAAPFLEGSAARWLNGLVQQQGYGQDFDAWARAQTLEQFVRSVYNRWHDPQGARKATDAINNLCSRRFKDVRELTDTVERLLVVPGVRFDQQVLPTDYLSRLPAEVRTKLVDEAYVKQHTFASFSKKALDIEAKLGSAHKVGERVWIKVVELGQELGISRKLMPQFFGAWEILDIVGDQPDGPSYVIRIPPHLRTNPVFHASKLAPYAATKQFPSRRSMLPPTMNGEVDIDQIVEHRVMPVPRPSGRERPPKPRMQYRVSFRHHLDPKEDRRFTREELMRTAPQVIAGYERALKGKMPAE
ncbi:hypothetical protein CBR_g55537 [Chara braunii]|uniref:Tf2-1-like SH3-like domain-containing protein n=1 Tax=Chara braunii TaxID=69332 RepID=A0A388MD11_CHABU|nr:hypothetical protein CBR_g55537 [Chara braunii]|eukprot:GBG92456.1 hypothetical protein CBR_g55537 [Chara braunii]